MRAMTIEKLAFVAVLGTFGAAVAPNAARADAPPQPGQEITDLKPFAGTWTCTGKTKDGKAFTAKAVFDQSKELNGFWYEVRYARDKTKDGPGFAGHGILGFDTANSKYYFTGADSFGGWAVLVGSLSNKVLDLSGQANQGDHVTGFKFKMDAAKANTLVWQIGPDLEDENDCKR
jgi:hypothetical protein